ncbi:hypothetical protein Hamer_G025109 [Homarus americanus]|uniref:Uncharacterized protein n=1 Tax=Homarus americanus TaxID=6706 RepID=A0A8J5N8W2_HOMAM|nr:hypothetical protein Hamer_G025109 [Homarus americanus]
MLGEWGEAMRGGGTPPPLVAWKSPEPRFVWKLERLGQCPRGYSGGRLRGPRLDQLGFPESGSRWLTVRCFPPQITSWNCECSLFYFPYLRFIN